MPLKTPRDLFIHELSDTMSAEHIVLKMLGELESESDDGNAKAAYTHHKSETEHQIGNLEKVFDILGEKPEKTTCFAAEGLKKEHAALKKEKPSAMVQELGNLGGAAKTEHYEIASYTMLVQMAADLGEQQVVDLLTENLHQEEEMASKVESLMTALGKEVQLTS